MGRWSTRIEGESLWELLSWYETTFAPRVGVLELVELDRVVWRERARGASRCQHVLEVASRGSRLEFSRISLEFCPEPGQGNSVIQKRSA